VRPFYGADLNFAVVNDGRLKARRPLMMKMDLRDTRIQYEIVGF
jgi:hypothetical protein